MNWDIQRLRNNIKRYEELLAGSKIFLSQCVRNCKHEWSNPVSDHIYTEGPGDPPGTMGIDCQLPFCSDPRTEYRWKRICSICGEVQYTKKTTEHITTTPDFGL